MFFENIVWLKDKGNISGIPIYGDFCYFVSLMTYNSF